MLDCGRMCELKKDNLCPGPQLLLFKEVKLFPLPLERVVEGELYHSNKEELRDPVGLTQEP